MVKHELALLETGSKTVNEFIQAYFDKKPIHSNTSDIRRTYCDKCNMLNCDKCFMHDCLQEIYNINPFA